MHCTEYLEVDVDREQPVEIQVRLSYSSHETGIGPYDYAGQECFDKGEDVIAIDDWSWDQKGFTPDEISLVEHAIEAQRERWELSLLEMV